MGAVMAEEFTFANMRRAVRGMARHVASQKQPPGLSLAATRGEKSAGLSIRHHVPEKDGILAGLLCCEMVARRGKPLGRQLQNLFVKVGSSYPQRENFRLTEEVKRNFTEKLGAESQ
jgi:phosphomannomutase